MYTSFFPEMQHSCSVTLAESTRCKESIHMGQGIADRLFMCIIMYRCSQTHSVSSQSGSPRLVGVSPIGDFKLSYVWLPLGDKNN